MARRKSVQTNNDIKPGDLVRVNIPGTPVMIVASVRGEFATCVFVNSGNLCDFKVRLVVLKKLDRKPIY